MHRIGHSWNQIAEVFDGRCISVLDANGQRMLTEAIWASMNGNAAKPVNPERTREGALSPLCMPALMPAQYGH